MKNVKKIVRNWIISKVAKRYGYEIVNKWIYFTFNYSYADRENFQRMYDKNLGDHFYEKFSYIHEKNGAHAVMGMFWCELSEQYRRKLFEEWFVQQYVNKSNKPKWISI